MENTIKQLKQFRTDAIYEKKKHYNASVRKHKYYKLISINQIALNAITGTALLKVVLGEECKLAEIFALILTIISTILASAQKIGDYENQAQGNVKVADMYLRISKKINLTLNFIKDGVLSSKDIMEKTEEIYCEISQAKELGSRFTTSNRDYIKAQSGIKNGEEDYTDEELDLWE